MVHISHENNIEIQRLGLYLGFLSENWSRMLAKYHVAHPGDLSAEDADELLRHLRTLLFNSAKFNY